MKRLLLLGFVGPCAPVWAQNPVTIHVVDAQSAPVPAATVEVRLQGNDEVVLKSLESNAQGDVTFDLPALPSAKAPIPFFVVAKGFAFARGVASGGKAEIKLAKGAIWRGIVADETDKPVAGAKVVVNGGVIGDGKDNFYLFGSKLIDRFTATTAADGSFEIADVTAKGVIYRLSAPRFTDLMGEEKTLEHTSRFKLHPGAVIGGRLLGIDGKPLPGVQVRVQTPRFGSSSVSAPTEKDGTFSIDTLPPGVYSVSFDAPDDLGVVIPALENVKAEPKEVAKPLEFRAASGVVVTGVVRDDKDGKPIKGVRIGMNGPSRPSSTTGALSTQTTGDDGTFSFRCLPGLNRFYVARVSTGYLRSSLLKEVTVGTQPLPQLVFNLVKTSPVRGHMVDENGKPISASVKVDYSSSIQSDAEGKWQLDPSTLDFSQNTIQLGGGDTEDGYFEVISPASIDINDPRETTIRVRKKNWLVLPGRALKLDGTPLEGVDIDAQYYSSTSRERGRSTMFPASRQAISNANGDFTIPQIRSVTDIVPEMFTVKGRKTGYVFRSGGEISKNGPIWQVSDLIFAPLDRKISGTTTPGARLTVDGIEVTADGTGKFGFEGLAMGDSPVFAAKDDLFGGGPVQEPFQIELKKQPAQGIDLSLAKEIWKEADRDSVGKDYRLGPWFELQGMAGEDQATQLDKVSKRGDETILALCMAWEWKADPALLIKACNLVKNADFRAYILMTAATKSDDLALKRLAITEMTANLAKNQRQGFGYEMDLYEIVPLIAKVEGEQAGIAALDRAVAFTLKNHGIKSVPRNENAGSMGRDQVLAMRARVVAAGSPALLEHIVAQIAAEPAAGYQTQAYGNALPVLARSLGYEAALPFLKAMEALPETVRGEEPDNGGGFNLSKAAAFDLAVSNIVPMMEKAPDEALKLARRVQDPTNRPQALAAAARFQTGPEAAKLWQEVVASAALQDAPCFAAWGWDFDHALGEKLFATVRQRMDAEGRGGPRLGVMAANYAFYFARVNPAQARYLLELEWGYASQNKLSEQVLSAIAVAMSAIDGKRAAAMARLIPPGRNNESLEARRKIGQYLTMSLERRSQWRFQNWRDSTALPGDITD
ncbi:hypothetical protein EON80_05300 [bacterium]|nr:MAG: hypothetical protein EON80_05300 [bacterium]